MIEVHVIQALNREISNWVSQPLSIVMQNQSKHDFYWIDAQVN